MGNPLLALTMGWPPGTAPSARHTLVTPSQDNESSGASNGWHTASTEVYNGAGIASFTDLDLTSAGVEGPAFARLAVTIATGTRWVSVRPNGDTDFALTPSDTNCGGVNTMDINSAVGQCAVLECITDSSNILEWRCENTTGCVITLIGWAPATTASEAVTITGTVAGAWNDLDYTATTTEDAIALIKLTATTETSFCNVWLRPYGDAGTYSTDDPQVGTNIARFSGTAPRTLLLEVPLVGGKAQLKCDDAGENFTATLVGYIPVSQGWVTASATASGLAVTTGAWRDLDISSAYSGSGMAWLRNDGDLASDSVAVRKDGSSISPYAAYNLSWLGSGCQSADFGVGSNFVSVEVAAGAIEIQSNYNDASFSLTCVGYLALTS